MKIYHSKLLKVPPGESEGYFTIRGQRIRRLVGRLLLLDYPPPADRTRLLCTQEITHSSPATAGVRCPEVSPEDSCSILPAEITCF